MSLSALLTLLTMVVNGTNCEDKCQTVIYGARFNFEAIGADDLVFMHINTEDPREVVRYEVHSLEKNIWTDGNDTVINNRRFRDKIF